MIRNLTRSVCALLLASVSLLSVPASAADSRSAAAVPDPVVFVHGWNSDGSTWESMAGRFRADGWPADRLDQWSYNTAQSNATTAAQLADEVERVLDRTGATKVDIVTHSMGGLSSRHYLKNLQGTSRVDAWVSLAGPNHGTETARLCGDVSCVEMRPGSEFLRALNSGDETPGSPRYATWVSPCDGVVNPRASVALTGAANHTTGCLNHSAVHTSQEVYGEVKAHIR